MAWALICASGIYMSRTAAQIRASARKLAPTRRDALTLDRSLQSEAREMVKRLRAEGILGPEIASLFGITSQRVYQWLDGAGGPPEPSSQADALRAEALGLAERRELARAAAAAVNARAKVLAFEVDECEGIGPGEFCEILGVDRQQHYSWLGRKGAKI